MKIDIKTVIIAALAAYIIMQKKNAGVAGFFPSNKPTLPSNPGPLQPYGARWGNPKPSADTTTKANMVV